MDFGKLTQAKKNIFHLHKQFKIWQKKMHYIGKGDFE